LIPALPDVVFATKAHEGSEQSPDGVLLYVRTGDDTDTLAWIDEQGELATESQLAVLLAARCEPEEPARVRREDHHKLVRAGVQHVITEASKSGGQLGLPSGARYKTYYALKRYLDRLEGKTAPLGSPDVAAIKLAQQEIYRSRLRESARDTLNRMLRSGADEETIARRVLELREDERLTVPAEGEEQAEPQIICSLGLIPRARVQ
jgi:hypothetical protein